MTWVNLKFGVGLEIEHPESLEFTVVISKIQKIIEACLDITDDKLIITYDQVWGDWEVKE